jgi:SAM-dependent methyltransferase
MEPGTAGIENLMAGDKPICPVLQENYGLSPDDKIKFLKTEEGRYLFDNLPEEVSRILREGFLSGAHGKDVPGWGIVVDYFQKNSEIIPALTKNPGTFTMLERMYHLHSVTGVIDEYFLRCKAGGQALRNRYEAVTEKSCQFIDSVLESQTNCLLVDFGSGPGRNVIEVLKLRPDLKKSLLVECVDIDKESIEKGEQLIRELGIKEISFIEGNMLKLHSRYRKKVDFGLLIGVLCGMTFNDRVGLLRILKHYFKPGGKIIAAALLDEMAKEDLLCAYVLRETAGWILQYRPLGELQKAFEAAGWTYDGYFQEEPTRLYEIGIGIAR